MALKAVIETPDMVMNTVRGVYKRQISSILDYNLRDDGKSNSLWLISMRITNRCNQRCAICAQWGEHGYNLTRPNSQLSQTIPVETYKKMVDDISHLKPHIYITGGEPFLYKELVPLVNYMKKKKLSVQIVTNGVLLEKYADEIVDNGWDIICASIDGSREVHDKCRGLEGAYDTLFRGIEKIQKLKSRQRTSKPYILTLTTVSKTNASSLVESLKEAQKFHPDFMVIYYSWFTTEEIGQRHVSVMQEKLNCTPRAWKGYLLDREGINLPELVKNVQEIKSTDFGCPALFVPDLKLEDIPTYYLEPDNILGYDKCVAPWFMVDIMPDGSVVLCRDHPDYMVGNISDESLIDIYNNERFRAFRRVIRNCENGLFPICARCCGLMGY
jgi:MoaA/NifB/PqqE/SkfB family radical SAM enzyme